GGEPWAVVNLPALAEADDPLGRRAGEALWPERYDAARLAEIKQAQGAFWFSAMYQQRPVLPEGNLFKRGWFRQFHQDGSTIVLDSGVTFDRAQTWRLCVVDPASSEKETSDYTAIGTFAVGPGNTLLVLDMVRERLGVEQIVPRLAALAAHYKPKF